MERLTRIRVPPGAGLTCTGQSLLSRAPGDGLALDSTGFHCGRSGGKQIRKETIQTPATMVLARLGVMIERYLTGRVTATYLSTLIAHKFKIDAVDIHTSVTSQPRHHTWPNIQTSRICLVLFCFVLFYAIAS